MRAGGALELVRFGRDPLAFLEALHRDDRDVIPLQLGTQPVLLVTRPDLIALALENDDWPPLSRGRLMAFQRWCPGGLVTTSGAEHHRQVAEIEARWHDELDRVLGDRPATSDDVGSLPYTVMVVEEALRLVPPSWAFFRALTGDYALDGHAIPAGHVMAVSPWFTHRDGRYWPEPLHFDPDRFAPGATTPPRLSYFPFSAGPYGCHGPGLATSRAVLLLATLGQRWSFRSVGPEPPPLAGWALEPRGGAHVTPVARRAVS